MAARPEFREHGARFEAQVRADDALVLGIAGKRWVVATHKTVRTIDKRVNLCQQGEVEERLQRRRKMEEREMDISLGVALKNPIVLTDACSQHGDAQLSDSVLDQTVKLDGESPVNLTRMPIAHVNSLRGFDEKGAVAHLAQANLPLPAHLTREILAGAYTELSPGAQKSIEACLQCWKTGKIGSDEIQQVLESFAGSSEVLKKHLAPCSTPPASEVATFEQMLELKTIFDR